MDTASATATPSCLHPFERAGLGKAPFRFTMVEQDRCYGERILNRDEYERTGVRLTTKPGGSCAYCGTYIIEMFNVRSSDGRTFHVGIDCIRKLDADPKLVLTAELAARKAAKAKRHAREAAQVASVTATLADTAVREKLAALPHPSKAMADQGATLLDWCGWMLEHAGASGKCRVARVVARALKP